jgi:predicted deacylase
MELGGKRIDPGTVTRVTWEAGEWSDGTPMTVPAVVVRGVADGPTLWVNGALHGDEIDGTVALWNVIGALDPSRMRGTLVAVLVLNVSAFAAMRRTSPIDDLDFNRIWPGDPRRSYSHQRTAAYAELVAAHATHYMDLHGGGNTHDVVHYLIYRDGLGEASAASRAMALACGSPIVWRSTDRWLDNGLFTYLTARRIPSVIVECGGEGKIRPAQVAAHETSVLNVMRHLRMIEGDAPPVDVTVSVREADFFFSTRGGMWLSDRVVGEVLQEGDLVGVVRDRYGDVQEEVRCQAPRGALLALRTFAGCPSGTNLGIIGVME